MSAAPVPAAEAAPRGPARDAAAPGRARRHRSGPLGWLGRNPLGWVFVAPWLAYLVVVFAVPLVQAVWMSLHDAFFTAPGVSVPQPWVGLGNYAEAVRDPQVRRAFLNIAEFLVINVPLTAVLSLLLASALNARLRLRGFFRAAYYIPYVTASIAVVAVWLFLFSSNGLVNRVLGPLAPDPSWLSNTAWAMPVIAVFVTWKGMGFYVMLFLAALQNIPAERYEAAEVDGASRFGRWRAVTVPGVRPVMSLVVLLAIITGANLFTEPYLLTAGGGPVNASTTPVLVMYQRGIEQGRPGYASAIGIVLVVLVLVVGLVSRRLTERGGES